MSVSLIEKAFGFTKAMANQLINNGLKLVDDKTFDERVAICNSCDKKNKYGQCKLCGCYIKMKAALPSEQCPHNPPKWEKISNENPHFELGDQLGDRPKAS